MSICPQKTDATCLEKTYIILCTNNVSDERKTAEHTRTPIEKVEKTQFGIRKRLHFIDHYLEMGKERFSRAVKQRSYSDDAPSKSAWKTYEKKENYDADHNKESERELYDGFDIVVQKVIFPIIKNNRKNMSSYSSNEKRSSDVSLEFDDHKYDDDNNFRDVHSKHNTDKSIFENSKETEELPIDKNIELEETKSKEFPKMSNEPANSKNEKSTKIEEDISRALHNVFCINDFGNDTQIQLYPCYNFCKKACIMVNTSEVKSCNEFHFDGYHYFNAPLRMICRKTVVSFILLKTRAPCPLLALLVNPRLQALRLLQPMLAKSHLFLKNIALILIRFVYMREKK